MARRTPAPCSCGAIYDDFRTGLTFAEVQKMMHVHTDDVTQWRYKRRNSVLGYWRSLKIMMWDGEHGGCE